jgi:hypothetical protein
MAGYLGNVQFHAEREWAYRHDVELPKQARPANLRREHRLSRTRRLQPEPAHRRAPVRWLGERLVSIGLRLGAGSPTVAGT